MNDEIILIAFGANQPSGVGDPHVTYQKAFELLENDGVVATAKSRLWATPAFPPGAGPRFLNAAFVAQAPAPPRAVLGALHRVERALGRTRRVRWGPRTCDLDLIAYGDAVAPDAGVVRALMEMRVTAADAPPDELILPHPRMHERAFVLAPLADVAPEWRHPLTGLTVLDMLGALPQEERDAVETIDDD